FIDLWGSELKLLLFGWLIGIIASYKGLTVGAGAEGVGKAVNESVVASLVAIAMVSVVYTQLFLALYPEASTGL
ncbi:MAG: ABC transporter permease, partial [Solirubrobacterales bacterium]